MIQDRVHKQRRNVLYPGCASLMRSIEDTLVTLMNKMSSIRQPLNCTTDLELAFSLMKGSPIENKVIEWKNITLITIIITSYWVRNIRDHF